MKLDRRTFLTASLGLAAGASTTALLNRPKYHVTRRQPRSRVAILRAESYSDNLESILHSGLELFHLDLRVKTVLLKPNLVDYIPGNQISTLSLLLAAAVECFRCLGAKTVLVGEGPGHQRDTELVLLESCFSKELCQLKVPFVDLNRGELVMTPLLATYTRMSHMWLPRAVLEADFVVSMPKVKTHHWSGVTLSMKNMFGVVPGAKYGWPKNILHWKGIQESILDVCATGPVHFVIAAAIVAMEGNGPLNGHPRPLNRIVLADDPVAADATCARLMGLEPTRITHIRIGSQIHGNPSTTKIAQVLDTVYAHATPFDRVPQFHPLPYSQSTTPSPV